MQPAAGAASRRSVVLSTRIVRIMKRLVAALAVLTAAATSVASGTASGATPPSLTVAGAVKAIPYPMLPVVGAKAAFPMHRGVGTELDTPCVAPPATILTIPAFTVRDAFYDRGNVQANTSVSVLVSVFVFKSPAAAEAALKVLAHAEHACPRDSTLSALSLTLRIHIVTNAATTIAGWPGWQLVDRSAAPGEPAYQTGLEEFVRRGNALLDVWALADSGYGDLASVQKQARQVTGLVVGKLDAQFR